MIAAGLDRADLVALLLARGANPALASTFVDLNALTSPGEADGTRQSTRAAGKALPARADVPGVTRPYRYNELVSAQGGLTALHFAARQGSARWSPRSSTGTPTSTSPAPATSPHRSSWHHQRPLRHRRLPARSRRRSEPRQRRRRDAALCHVNAQWAPIAAYPQPREYLQQSLTYST